MCASAYLSSVTVSVSTNPRGSRKGDRTLAFFFFGSLSWPSRHVAATPNNGNHKGNKRSRGELSYIGSNLPIKANEVAYVHRTVCISLRESAQRHVRARASRYVSRVTERTGWIISKLFLLLLLHGTCYSVIDNRVFITFAT